MKKLLILGLVGIAMVLVTASAQAGGKYYGGKNYGHKGHYYNNGYNNNDDYGDEILIGAGIIGGAILLNGLLTRPQYASAPVYYAPPRAPICERDQVYRYLPDGRIQWGTRTRCY